MILKMLKRCALSSAVCVCRSVSGHSHSDKYKPKHVDVSVENRRMCISLEIYSLINELKMLVIESEGGRNWDTSMSMGRLTIQHLLKDGKLLAS